jgi:hypothetical protein
LFDIDGLVSSSQQVLDYGIFTTTASFNSFTSSYNTGSFTGSFFGNGSGLFGVVTTSQSGSFAITGSNTFIGNQIVTGSIIASSSLHTLAGKVAIGNPTNISSSFTNTQLQITSPGVSTSEVALRLRNPNGNAFSATSLYFQPTYTNDLSGTSAITGYRNNAGSDGFLTISVSNGTSLVEVARFGPDSKLAVTGSLNVTGSVTATAFTGSLSYTDLTDVPTLVSGSSQVISLLPNGTVSGSSQVLNYNIFTTTSSFNEFTSSHNSGSFSGSFVGEVVLNASAGIDFSANTSGPGSTSKVLDWYEEGTFDYTVSGSVSGYWTPRIGYESIAYTKIGRQVTITGQIEIDASSTPDGDAIFTLPYTASNGFEFRTTAAVSLRGENPTTSGTVHAYVEDGQAAFKLMAVETGSSFILGDTHLDSAWEFMVGLTYFTNS